MVPLPLYQGSDDDQDLMIPREMGRNHSSMVTTKPSSLISFVCSLRQVSTAHRTASCPPTIFLFQIEGDGSRGIRAGRVRQEWGTLMTVVTITTTTFGTEWVA
ncbi:hypothetical protein EVAR_40277_1 [Eumeta japonica]|uniref:Uncharacterized protein n=1 Tax=Eumeta variegata TaxID=151549 RepID=A0A4C1WZH8_EUMVA|nr:hypothetical protein EVAR_40277_1 [Eumeta japonica]